MTILNWTLCHLRRLPLNKSVNLTSTWLALWLLCTYVLYGRLHFLSCCHCFRFYLSLTFVLQRGSKSCIRRPPARRPRPGPEPKPKLTQKPGALRTCDEQHVQHSIASPTRSKQKPNPFLFSQSRSSPSGSNSSHIPAFPSRSPNKPKPKPKHDALRSVFL